MNYYKEIIQMIDSAIELNDSKVLDIMLGGVLPLVDPQNREYVEDLLNEKGFNESSPEIEGVIMKYFPMDPEKSQKYIMSRIVNKSLSRKNLDLAIDNLGKYYGVSVTQAIYAGDIEIAEKIVNAFGGKEVSITSSGRIGSKIAIDGISRYSMASIVDPIDSIETLARVIDIASSIGITRPKILPGRSYQSCIFSGDHLSGMDSIAPAPCHDLPIISGDKVIRPELLIAFDQARNKSDAVKNIYSRIPVLVKSQDIGRYETIRSFRSFHKISEKVMNPVSESNPYGRSYSTTGVELKDFSDKVKDMDRMERFKVYQKTDEFAFTVIADDVGKKERSSGCEKMLEDMEFSTDILKDEVIISLLASEEYKTGFNEDGYVLCVIDFDEISALNIGEVNEDLLRLAEISAHKFLCPLSVSQLIYPDYEVFSSDSRLDHPVKIGIRATSGRENEIIKYAMLGDDQRNIVRNKIGKNVTLSLCPIERQGINLDQHAFIQNEFAETTNGPVHISNDSQIDRLHSKGYRFSNESELFFGRGVPSSAQTMVKVLEMGGWPINRNTEKPESVAKCLTASVRKPGNFELDAFLLHAGIDEVISVAKTEKQWQRVAELFPDDSDKIMRLVPNRIKRSIISSDMDI